MNRDFKQLAAELGVRGRQGGHFLYARCPLHQDRTPSFSLNVQSGTWKCFKPGCGEGIFVQLVMRVLDITMTEAEFWVVSRGRPLDNATLHRSITEMLGEDAEEAEPVKLDEGYFASLGRQVMPIDFLRRGFTWEMCQRWDIRYDPVRERVVVPIFDGSAQFAGWVARSMGQDAYVKFLNMPGMAKQSLVYPLWPQDARIPIVLVEGPLKAIWMREAGVPAATIFGSELAEEQISAMRRNGNVKMVLGLDADEAGRTGTRQALARLLERGWLFSDISILQYPDGAKDANDCTFEQLRAAYASARAIEPLDLMEA